MSPRQGMLHGFAQSLAELWHRRELLNLLVRREIRAKYKDSALGLLWSLARPLVLLGIYYVVIGKFLGVARGIDFFAVHIYIGMAIWSLFQESVSMGTASIVVNAGIVRKSSLPREVFPLTSVGTALFNFGIQLVIAVVLAVFTCGINPGINFLHFPLAIAVVLVWAVAAALLLSAANVYLRDVQYLTEVALMIGFYLSPIIYPWKLAEQQLVGLFGGVVEQIYLADPITLAVLGTQRVLWNTGDAAYPWPSFLAYRLLVALAVGLVALFLAQRVFNRLQRNFAQEI
ncbi:MAG: ABC transporter permease [Propionibacteriaceae bacterium]|jgi:ABC-2 type transport system permease protein|nr:ABC transporter permease [Propionibacteriaceae bacterium]